MRRAWLLLFALGVACGAPGARATPPATPSAELSPALAPLSWWLGAWISETGGREHWVAAAGAIYGIALTTDGFEVMIVDDGDSPGQADGVLRLIAIPGGARAVELRQREVKDRSVTFANDAHDDPKAITYARHGDELHAVLAGERSVRFRFTRGSHEPAPELEAADRAFAGDTGARGVDGWMAAFAPDGGMLRRGQRITGAAIVETMAPLLASGRLAWAPIASARLGDLGFTVGKATYTGKAPADRWRSTYVTIWQRQPDGAWKVRFDTGRVVHEGEPVPHARADAPITSNGMALAADRARHRLGKLGFTEQPR